ncbi:MAG: hypothetical protein NC091_02500 [Bacteroides sp.]|nr:hypothetical protein [Bacteroides sp.]
MKNRCGMGESPATPHLVLFGEKPSENPIQRAFFAPFAQKKLLDFACIVVYFILKSIQKWVEVVQSVTKWGIWWQTREDTATSVADPTLRW